MIRRAALWVLAAPLAVTGGCDQGKSTPSGGSPNASANQESTWRADSTVLASKPTILFRTFAHEKGRGIAPIATISDGGLRQLKLGNRGWRAFDVAYLHEGNTLDAVRDGRASGTVRLTRGMWESSGQLDSIPRCRLIPTGLSDAPASIALALAGARPALKPTAPLSSDELQEALHKAPLLIAPSNGVPIGLLSRYRREVHVMATGVTSRPSILVIYNDPEKVSDKLHPIGQRPRHLVTVLDKGLYGYRTSFEFSTLGNAQTEPRMTFLDYVDVDGDGKAELFFGFKYRHIEQQLDATKAYHYENDRWKEVFRASVRCP
ncbi:MAG: hypothetical protein ABMA00_07960 [Gemmatimonas sp.]